MCGPCCGPHALFPRATLKESEGQRAGQNYAAANGQERDNCNDCDPDSSLALEFDSLDRVMFDDLRLSSEAKKGQQGMSSIVMRKLPLDARRERHCSKLANLSAGGAFSKLASSNANDVMPVLGMC